MKMYSTYFTAFFLCMSIVLGAQNHYNIRFNSSEFSPAGQACYEVLLASADAVDLNLAGQNYRMYYDAEKLKFNPDHSRILLTKEKYTNLVIKDNILDMDASGEGALSFDNHLSFLNIGNDLKDELVGGIILSATGEWVSTANICFDVVDANNADYGIFWARPELTQPYATAYVEVAEWKSPNVTVPAKVAIYFDHEINTSANEQLWEDVPNIYPNPTQDKVFIDYAGGKELLLQVFSVTGQLLMEEKFPANTAEHTIRLGNFATGIYQLKLSNDTKILVKRIERI